MPQRSIETGVDKLVNLVNSRERISMKDAAKELGVPVSSVEEWASFLEEEGIVIVEYKFTTPYLVPKAFSEKEIEAKLKEFHNEKDNMARKVESEIAYLDKQQDLITEIKSTFIGLKKGFSGEVSSAKAELDKLDQFNRQKEELSKELEKQKKEFEKTIFEMEKTLIKDEQAYESLIKNNEQKFSEGKKILDEEQAKEKELEKIEEEIKRELEKIRSSEETISAVAKKGFDFKKEVEQKKEMLEEYKKKSEEYLKKLEEKQSALVASEKESEKYVAEATKKGLEASERFKDLLSKREKAEKTIEDLETNISELKKLMGDFLMKVGVFETAAKKQGFKGAIEELQKKFSDVEKKKGEFKKNLDKFYDYV